MISPSVFFFSFHFFEILVLKKPKMENNNYICHVPYLRNSIAFDHDFWYTCVKR